MPACSRWRRGWPELSAGPPSVVDVAKTAARPGFVCTECGWTTVKWQGRCGECQTWGSVSEAGAPRLATVQSHTPTSKAVPIARIDPDLAIRTLTGVGELDRVLGDGIVPGAVVLLAGEPGVGKSTLLLEVAARWEAGRKRSQAEEMVKRLTSWLAANPRRLIAAEQGFRARLTDSDPVIEITGKADRIELDGAGRLVVIDFKTGKSIPTDEEVARHAQLGTYQLAIAYGGLEDLPGVPPSAPPGGAILVQLGKNRKDGPEQHQPALADSDDPDWAERMVRGAAAAMAAGSFNAAVNPGCAT